MIYKVYITENGTTVRKCQSHKNKVLVFLLRNSFTRFEDQEVFDAEVPEYYRQSVKRFVLYCYGFKDIRKNNIEEVL